MTQNDAAMYEAYATRDRRFDGMFFIGVTSTGIYCRPVCTARTPKRANCRFFPSAAAAELATFRPCLRCRPELAPGRAPVDSAQRVATRIADRIAEGLLDDGASLERIADEFHFSSRQIRRIVRSELGVSPIDLVQTRRLLLAKQLLTETSLTVTSIAYASGFSSLRRFNDAFRTRYGMAPTALRRSSGGAAPAESDHLTLQVSYRPPYDWAGILSFLRARALTGAEFADEEQYARTVSLGGHSGWIRVRNAPEKCALCVDVSATLTPVLPALLGRVRDIFDLNARPDLVATHLARDPLLAAAVAKHAGLRVPGAFDGFELALRAVLGQQITVKAAATLAGRFVARFGEPVVTPIAGLDRIAPDATKVARLKPEAIAELGIVRTRAECIITIAREIAHGRLRLVAGADAAATAAQLVALPGIGPWTAEYIAMRALRWPDSFPKEDVVLRKRLGGLSSAAALARSEAWSPWRSYATLLLWRMENPPIPSASQPREASPRAKRAARPRGR